MLKLQQMSASNAYQQIGHNIKINHYSTALNLCRNLEKQLIQQCKIDFTPFLLMNRNTKKQLQQCLQLLELQSLKSYCLMHLNELDESKQILELCLKINPNHVASRRRLAYLYEKEGNIQQSLNEYKKMGMYQPDNIHITHSIIKLSKKLKTYGGNHFIQKVQTQISKTTFQEEPTPSANSSKQHVTFGASEIIEVTSDQSDQYFAHIKHELNKLNQVKPKKSILKCSKINKESASIPYYSQEEKVELDELDVKKTFSMKSCSTQSPQKWESQSLKEEKLMPSQSIKKQKKKKKCVSFSVGKQVSEEKE